MFLKIATRVRYPFSVVLPGSNDHIIKTLKGKDPEYFQQNGQHIFEHLITLVQNKNWAGMLKFYSNIELIHVDNWQLRLNLGYYIRKHIEAQYFVRYDDEKFASMISALYLAQYEPDPVKQANLYQQAIKRIENSPSQLKLDAIFKLGNSLLELSPRLFQNYRNQLEQYICQTIQEQKGIYYPNMKKMILSGTKSRFWNPQFMQKLYKYCHSKYIDGHTRTQLLYNNTSSEQVEIDRPLEEKFSVTEQKIANFLEDIGYLINRNVYINQMEFDILMPGKILIEYNGLTHYRINSPKGRLEHTQHDIWKRSVANQLGYTVIDLPFDEWEKHPNEKEQKKYLIYKIEGELIKKYFGQREYKRVMRELGKVQNIMNEEKKIKHLSQNKKK